MTEEQAQNPPPEEAQEQGNDAPHATRHDLQWGRRLFHAANGLGVATAYLLFFSRDQIVTLMGLMASLLYLLEQIRIRYPEYTQLSFFNRYLLRAEERLRESSAFPYAMALLLTIITFPQMIAVAAIYVLAVADPLAAVVGIAFGKHALGKNKTWEGSFVFLLATFLCLFLVLFFMSPAALSVIFVAASVTALLVAIFEVVPLRLDDNLTIPLFTALVFWIVCMVAQIPH
jgi:dolichol kinase